MSYVYTCSKNWAAKTEQWNFCNEKLLAVGRLSGGVVDWPFYCQTAPVVAPAQIIITTQSRFLQRLETNFGAISRKLNFYILSLKCSCKNWSRFWSSNLLIKGAFVIPNKSVMSYLPKWTHPSLCRDFWILLHYSFIS